MKILIENNIPCGPRTVTEGLVKALMSCRHDVYIWNKDTESAFGVFQKFEPQIFLGKSFHIDRATAKNIIARPEMKVALYGSDYGSIIEKIDLKKYPILVANENEIEILAEIKKNRAEPIFIYKHYPNRYIDGTLGYWRDIGLTPISMLNAWDIFEYHNAKRKEAFTCDASFIGGYWKFKAVNLDRYIFPLLNSSLNIKIFGNQPWPSIPQYLGFIDDQEVKHLFASSTVNINIHEPHSTSFGFDIIERPYKVMGCGQFLISDYVAGAAEDVFSQGECVFVQSPVELYDRVHYFVKYPKERLSYMIKGKETVRKHHSYHHRIASMFDYFGLYEEAANIMRNYDYLLQQLNEKGL